MGSYLGPRRNGSGSGVMAVLAVEELASVSCRWNWNWNSLV